jgi:hypothetical protein
MLVSSPVSGHQRILRGTRASIILLGITYIRQDSRETQLRQLVPLVPENWTRLIWLLQVLHLFLS